MSGAKMWFFLQVKVFINRGDMEKTVEQANKFSEECARKGMQVKRMFPDHYGNYHVVYTKKGE